MDEEKPRGRLQRNSIHEEEQSGSVSWKQTNKQKWRSQGGKTGGKAHWRLPLTSESHLHTVLGWGHIDRVRIIVGY